MATQTQTPPEGFTRHGARSAFMDHNGPFYVKGKGHNLVMGVFVQEHHINHGGVAHGGLLATLADAAMGYAFATLSDPPGGALTINLSIDYIGTARLGDWVESKVDIPKDKGRIKFLNVFLVCNGKRIARASAIFAGNTPGD
jgi:acyl-coenzyme A thioesterase PaaI-like protein